MPASNSRILVIDASIARAAGTSENPVSSASREFLDAVLDICHRIAFNAAILEEWRRHQSKFTKRWRPSMYARKKIVNLSNDADARLSDRILGATADVENRRAMLKDIPLIVAALQVDHVVISLDEEARRLFHMNELNTIIWANPLAERQRMGAWLKGGAEPIDEWKLGPR